MSRVAILIWFVSIMLVMPSLSSADVKIMLKNGRTIIADSCRDTQDSLVCEKLGGTFSFSKREIENLKEIAGGKKDYEEEEPVPEETTEEGAPPGDTPAAGGRAAAEQAGDTLVRGVNPDADKRLDEINSRKLELKEEREKLVKEREQVREEIRKAGEIRSRDKFIELSNRDSEMKNKIDRFNAEAAALDQEEGQLIKSLKK